MANTEWTADAIRALRTELGITQLELAQRLQVHVSTVAQWEAGKSSPTAIHTRQRLGELANTRKPRKRRDAAGAQPAGDEQPAATA